MYIWNLSPPIFRRLFALFSVGRQVKDFKTMTKIASSVKNEDGSVIVAAMLVLVLLTIIGISATSTSNIELNIVANTQLHKMAFFTAESGWHVMSDWLDDQYPLPAENLGSYKWGLTDGLDNDGDGTFEEADEQVHFQTDTYSDPQRVPLSANLSDDYNYTVDSEFVGASVAPGWGAGSGSGSFLRFQYIVNSTGRVPARGGEAVSRIQVRLGKIREVGGS
jgi:PilX N-terminal